MMDYYAEYRRKLTTAADAAGAIPDGSTIVYGMSLAQPPALLGAIADRARADQLHQVTLYSFLPLEHAKKTILDPYLIDNIQHRSWFVTAADRGMVAAGLNYFVPCYLHQIPRLCSEYMKIDYTITTVSPMDRAGYFTFGTSNDFTSTAARKASHLIVEVNENMPRIFGDSLLHISEVEAVVENHVPLLELQPPPERPEDDVIGASIAKLIPDGATIQLGIGGLPNALARHLEDHRDLGIHSEMMGSGMINLVRKGVANGRRKNLHPRHHVFATAIGNKAMYDFMHDNSSMTSYAASYVCDPRIIAKNDHMIAVNSILETDFLGQVNAESIDGAQYSGTGGQLDFVRGAFDSRGGKSILAFYSTARNGTVSRVVPRLSSGATVTTPRMDVHYLATEYGIVDLKGKDTRERALAIIGLAHPSYRDDLMREAENMFLI